MTKYRRTRLKNAANRLKETVVADGKVDLREAKLIRSLVRPLAGEAQALADFYKALDGIVAAGRLDFDEQLAVLKALSGLVAYLEEAAG